MNYIMGANHGDAIFRVLNVDNINRIIDVLVQIKGDGCHIEKPTNAEGRNWKIILDGKLSDTPIPGSNDDPDSPLPLDYLIRFVSDAPRKSQKGDFMAQTDFVLRGASAEWLRDTMIPLGYCYIAFDYRGGVSTTSNQAQDNVGTGFKLKAQLRSGDKLYRLAHGNQHFAMLRRGDSVSIDVDVSNYSYGPAYILHGWNTDNNYITISKSDLVAGNAYAFLAYDTYLPDGATDAQGNPTTPALSRRLDHPAEIKFSSMNKAFFDDLVFRIANVTRTVIEDNVTNIIAAGLPYLFIFHRHSPPSVYPSAATPPSIGGPAGGWIGLNEIPGIADADDVAQLIANIDALHAQVMAWDVDAAIDGCDQLMERIEGFVDDIESKHAAMLQADAVIDEAIASLEQTAAELTRLENVATAQEQRIAALKQALGAT